MKGQTQAVTAVLITGVIVAAVASAYVWGLPLIQKRQGRAELNTLESSVMEVEASIGAVADSGQGATDQVTLDLDNGGVSVYPDKNYIEFTAYLSGGSYPVNSWELLKGDSRQGLSIGSGKYGIQGENTAGVVAAKQASASGSLVRYRVEFRNLRTTVPSGVKLRLVDIQASGATHASGDVTIQFSNEGQETDTGAQGVKISGKRVDRTRTVVSVDLR